MDFGAAIKTCLGKYATFDGRASRSEYWWFMLFWFLLSLAAGMVNDLASALVALGLMLPALAAASRRLHDIDKSGWLQLISIIPVIGWLLVLWWLVQPTGPANRFGAGPAMAGSEPVGMPPGA